MRGGMCTATRPAVRRRAAGASQHARRRRKGGGLAGQISSRSPGATVYRRRAGMVDWRPGPTRVGVHHASIRIPPPIGVPAALKERRPIDGGFQADVCGLKKRARCPCS
jgi:hypothetical protein